MLTLSAIFFLFDNENDLNKVNLKLVTEVICRLISAEKFSRLQNYLHKCEEIVKQRSLAAPFSRVTE